MELDGRLRREVIRDFFLAVRGYDSFDSQPLTAGVQKNDIGVSVSIGWTF